MEFQPPPIGNNIMRERKKRGMSLEDLAKKSGVSKSMLSQIEQEKTNPTVITVWKISRALNVDVQKLMETDNNTIIEVIRSQDASVIYTKDNLCTIRINTPLHMVDNLELYLVSFKPEGKMSSMPHYPDTEEFLTVIRGQLKLTAGEKSTVLKERDTARYKADIEHSIENIGATDAEAHLAVHFPI
jgi:XRE family transcriptional regulator, regulator of sulfur utilization